MKKSYHALLLCFILIIFSIHVFGNRQDSLLASIRHHLSKHEAKLVENESRKLLQLSGKDQDPKYKIEALKYLGISKHLQSNYDSAIILNNQVLKLSEEKNDSLNIGKTYLNLATSYNAKGDFEDAIKNALRSQTFFEALKDKNGQSRVQNLLGIFYFNRNDFSKALSYFEKYRKLAAESRDTGEIVSSLNNLSATLHKLKDYEKERQLIRQSISIQEKQGQKIRIGSAYENLGTLYLDTDSLKLADFYFQKARKSYEVNKNTHDLARLLLNTGFVKQKQKRYADAIHDYKKSLNYSQKGGFLMLEEQAFQKLAGLYEETQNFRQAYYADTKYVLAKDSVLNEENQKSINQLMVKFETAKKEKKIALQNLEIAQKTLENRHKSFAIATLVTLLIILILVVVVIYSRIKIRQERRLTEERMHMKQLQMNVVLESQESERKRFARDLHDGFGQVITALKIMIGQVNDSDEKSERKKFTGKATDLLDSMHNQLREIAHNLMPEKLMNEGLSVALNEYVSRISKTSNMEIELHTFGLEKRLNQVIEVNLYRIIQEWINNVIKYSGAKKLTIQLTGYENEINILIEDNGSGFEKEKLIKSKGWGWKNIQSRLEAINGVLEIDTRPGSSGTSFIIDLPIA